MSVGSRGKTKNTTYKHPCEPATTHTHTYSRTAPGHTEVGLGARSPPHTNDLIYYILVSINYDYLFGDDGAIIFSTMYNIRFFLSFFSHLFRVNHFHSAQTDDGCRLCRRPSRSLPFSLFIYASRSYDCHSATVTPTQLPVPACIFHFGVCVRASVLRFVFFSIRKCFACVSPTTTHC